MPRVAKPESSSETRVIAHVDMDYFYVQVEQRRRPNLRALPTAVVQYNSWKGGGLIAVGYEARHFGVKRSMRGDEAKKVCPDIHLVQVPVARGKADLIVYRNAGSEVVSILSRRGRCERASIDEVYLDLSEAARTMLAGNPLDRLESISEEALKSHVLGLHLDGANTRDRVSEWFLKSDADRRDKLLACGALIVAELRLEVLKQTEFTCSAGIAHNNMLAKLASGMNKPAQQTVVPFSCVKELLEPLPIKKITWLWNIARGICGEEVEDRLLPKSHGSGKTFPGSQALKTVSSVKKWLNELCEELNERLVSDLEQNKRIARTLTLHASAYKLNDSESMKKFPSKSCPLRYGVLKIQEDALNLFNAGLREFVGAYNVMPTGISHHDWAITGLSVSASKIVERPSGTHSIMKYFHNQDQTCTSINEPNSISHQRAVSSSSGNGSCERLQSVNPLIYLHEDEVRTNHDLQTLNSDGDEIDVFKDAHCTSKFEDSQDPSFRRMEQQEDLIIEASSSGSGSSLTQSKIGPGVKSDKQKRKFDKEKGTSSILRFFQSQSCIPEQVHVGEMEASSLENQHPETAAVGTRRSSIGEESRSGAWVYKREEIDPSVLNELPGEIQAEVRGWLHEQPQKKANSAKRGSHSIVHYFSPSTNT